MNLIRALWARCGHRTWMLLAALVCAGAALMLSDHYMTAHLAALEEKRFPQQAFDEVLVADRDLAPGQSLSAETVSVMRVPTAWAHLDLLRPAAFDDLLGRAVNRDIKRGTPIGYRDLSPVKPPNGLSRIPSGHRLVPITDIAGFEQILAGDQSVQVDVWEQTAPLAVSSGESVAEGFSVQSAQRIGGAPQAHLLVRRASLMTSASISTDLKNKSGEAAFILLPESLVGAFVAAKARGSLTFTIVNPAEEPRAAMAHQQRTTQSRSREIEVIVHARQGGQS